MRTCQAANTSDINIENKTGIWQAANTSDISIENKTCICQEANTISIKKQDRYMSSS